MNENSKVAVLGGGPFGLIITSILSPRVYPVYLWYADSRQAERLKKERVGQVLNNPYKIHENVEVISGYGQFADKPWVLLVVVPSRQFEDTLEHIIAQLSPDEEHLIVIFTKGVVSRNTRRKLGCVTFSQFVELQAEQHKRRVKVAVVNGPSLLSEIYSSHYSFFNIGCNDETAVAYLKDILTNEYIQAASSTDVIGVELGGVMKNPVAIACGIAEGLPQSGVNLQGMVLSQGFKEIFRLATSLGAVPNTLFGVSGLADLIATATSPTGRNRSYGVQFIRKLMAHENDPGLMDRVELFFRPTQFIEKEVMKNQDLIEGALAIGPILEIAADRNIRMPLFKVVYDILSRTRKPDALVTLFGGSPRTNLETAAAAARMPGISRAAGQNFKRLIERRIFHQVSGTRGMFDRIQKQCDNILSNLDRRLQKARKKKNVRELEELPREMELWTRLKSCEPGALHNCVEDLIRFYVNEISDNYNPAIRGPLIRTLAPMRWMTGGMHSGAAIPYVGGQVDELRNLAERYNILYAPVHRSHLDSVEVAFGLSWSRLPVPRYAAGINLMTSPFMSRVLKSLGAYAVDRERTRNILYLECLTRYATMMLEVGIPSL
ncbi:MAG: hypothetical protein KDK30_18365, partial [Leptospiraceae bacterium]|nr:hypothetical protein [Leptospiraceae bacterium]